MELNLNNWEHKSLNSKKLPTEEDLEDFFSCIVTEPKAKGKGFFETIPQFDYSKEARSYRSASYPTINTEGTWITPSLQELDPRTELSMCKYALVGNTENYNSAIKTGPEFRNLPPLGMTLDPGLVSILSKADESCCLSKEWYIKNFTDLNSIVYQVNSFITNFVVHECEIFKDGLQQRGYIQQSTHSEILDKCEKLRAAYPYEHIYILAETPLLDYLKVHSSIPGELMRNCWLVTDNYSSYGYSQVANKFAHYKSAVFTTKQMSARHEFEVHYKLQRENRRWKVYLAVIGKLGMQIPKDPLEEKESEVVLTDNHPRWDRLF